MPASEEPPARAPRWIAPTIGLAIVVLAAWTWGARPDALVDFGRELYAPWRLSEGDRLYVDIAWFNGPLSAWWNALWFSIFGPSLRVLALVNLALVFVAAHLLYRLVEAGSDRTTAVASTLTFVGVFAFGQYAGIANYDFITPYSHELTHGLLLALAALYALLRLARGGRGVAAFAAGFCVGAAFLTKAEVFLPCALAALLRLGGILASAGTAGRRPAIAGLFAAGLALPPVAAYAYLATAMSAGDALHAIAGSWPYLFVEEVRALPFYAQMSGLAEPAKNLEAMFTWAAGYALFFAAFGLAARFIPRERAGPPALAGAALVGVGAAAAALRYLDRDGATRPWPLFLIALGAAAAVRGWRRRGEPEEVERAFHLLSLVVLAGALLAKMLLFTRVVHYGFVLALPATLLVVVALVHRIPAWLHGRGRSGDVMRAAALGALVAFAGAHLHTTWTRIGTKTIRIGWGTDAFSIEPWRGAMLEEALNDLRERVGEDETLLVLPEGVTINYLLRRRNPTPYINFMPPEMIFYGERAIIEALEESPPDWIVLAHKDTHEYGLPFFGADYGRDVKRWVGAGYNAVRRIGPMPLVQYGRFGILILERRR